MDIDRTKIPPPLTIFKGPCHPGVGRSAVDSFVERHDEELVLPVLGQSGHGARRGAASMQHGQHFVRAIRADLPRVNVEALHELAVDNLQRARHRNGMSWIVFQCGHQIDC